MISKRNYLAIIIIMGVIFILFQFSQLMRDYSNDYSHNQYSELKTPPNRAWEHKVIHVGDNEIPADGKYILFIGDINTNAGSIVNQWTLYSKRELLVAGDPDGFSIEKYGTPEFMLIDSAFVDYEKDTKTFREYAENGISIVFLNLPDVETIESVDGLKDLFGISYVKEENVTVEGVKIFSGFMLGGETIYRPKKKSQEKRQDLALDMPWYITGGGTKTYLVGIMDEYYKDYEFKNDLFPAVVWRNSLNTAQVFCVNGDFMSDTAGLGILSSMIYELSTYQLYPIVNAQNTLVIDYPLMADENADEFFGIYSRPISAFQTEVVWPTLVRLAENNKLKYTCFMTPKYDYSDPAMPEYDTYSMLLKLFGEQKAEVGLSLEHAEGITLLEKLSFDKDYYDNLENRYPSTSAFMDLNDVDELDEALKDPYLRNVRTIACDADISLPILSYLTDDITLQSLTSNTKNFTYSRDLMLKSIETALGYDNAKLNLSDVAWPKSDEDHWENIYDDMSSSLKTYWQPFRVFDRTTLTESDQRVRTFLNLYSESKREGDTVTLSIEGRGTDTCWFILRTHGEKIKKITGATYKQIEPDAFLLEIETDEVVIELNAPRAN